MVPYDAKTDLLNHLDSMTRELSVSTIGTFTTARIASECHVSRSLASQYLNEFVRQGLAIKVSARPVLFFHRRGVERFFQTKFSICEFDSVRDLLSAAGTQDVRDFDRAIGFELSYSTCIEHLKSAIQYPPHGLPVLLVGEHGTGKQLMSELTYEFGMNQGILPLGTRYVMVDCARFEQPDADIERVIFGDDTTPGAVGEAAGGVVFITRFDHLPHVTRELILTRISDDRVCGVTKNGTPPLRRAFCSVRHDRLIARW